jgi:ABC-type uncharacterized transport system permease subunit
MLLSLAGGTFMPSESYPPVLRSIAVLTPNGSAQQGFVDVLAHSRTLAETAGRLAITWIWALATMGAALLAARRGAAA